MTDATMNDERQDTGTMGHFITREEFATTVERLAEMISDQTKAQAHAMAELRADLKIVGRPQWQALTFAFGVFSLVLTALWAVYSTGESSRRALLQENISLRTTSNEVQHVDMGRRIADLEAWHTEHGERVRALDAEQDEQINGLTREVDRLRGQRDNP